MALVATRVRTEAMRKPVFSSSAWFLAVDVEAFAFDVRSNLNRPFSVDWLQCSVGAGPLLVLLQQRPTKRVFGADVSHGCPAGKSFALVTLPLMSLQVVAPCERLSAGDALERLLPRVHPQVSHQIAALVEPLPAHAALVPLLACVCPLVGRQVDFECKPLLAEVARKGLLARVNPLVILQVDLLRECLLADATAEGLLLRVDSLMGGHVTLPVARVEAEAALVLAAFLAGACPLPPLSLGWGLAVAVFRVKALVLWVGGWIATRLFLDSRDEFLVPIQEESTARLRAKKAFTGQVGKNLFTVLYGMFTSSSFSASPLFICSKVYHGKA
uniref:Uncharacterized protein n=1 Tax=Ixodes ricinus TaxID=34613 RepID=A0A6B0V879_IXORI